ncbi:S41 family peptidase [Candidatus Uabimicrobium sp. HlEnr_7]|uniref:S41 family peptidase n=1 Tax=Candidatus Uabimicrobium helgolandensis TaxID=3095367 RepID=UPI003558A827
MMKYILILFVVVNSLLGQETQSVAQEQITEIITTVESKYYKTVDGEQITKGFVDGLAKALGDKHMELIHEKEYKIMLERKLQGIGAILSMKDGAANIVSPLVGGPAYKAGIKAADQIVEINGENTEGFDLKTIVSRLRGPRGTKVLIKVYRPATKKLVEITVVRDVIILKNHTRKMLDNSVLYISIESFFVGVAKDIQDTITSSKAQGIILDLRGCPGGMLNEAVALADSFLTTGIITQVQKRKEKKVIQSDKSTIFDGSMIVLVDKKTASAAELLAAALQENYRALVIGEVTFGKGSVQEIIRLKSGVALKMTVAHYLTPASNIVEKIGIIPDIEMKSNAIKIEKIGALVLTLAKSRK